MKLGRVFILILLVFLTITTANLAALQIGGSYRLGNLALDQVTSPAFVDFNDKNFNSWGLSFWASDKISDNLQMDAGFYSDPILRNISYTLFSFTENFLKLGVGPFFGFFNADFNTVLKPGISTSIRLELPAILFLDFRTDSSLASRLVIIGDYIQERTDVSFGFYVLNAICTVNIFSKKFTQKLAAWELIDALNEYSFMTHLFQKNIPYKITLKFAFQNLSRQFVETAATTVFTLNSIIVGTKLQIDFSDAIHFFVDMDNSVYTFGAGNLVNTIIEQYAFRGYAGIELDFDKLLPEPLTEMELAKF